MSSSSAISIKNLSKIYRMYPKPYYRLLQSFINKKLYQEKVAINNISIEILKGEVIGILGKNGSGKSTLLQLIAGILTPTKGSIENNGRIAALLELGSGFNPEFTGIENIYLNGAIAGLGKEEVDRSVEHIISFADIGDYINKPIKTYSSGMYVRLAFACAVNVNPDILIIDEALSVGDMQFQLKCIENMKLFKKRGTTILFGSHDSYSLRNFCDKALWMKDGEVIMNGSAEHVTEVYQNYMKSSVKSEEIVDPIQETGDFLNIENVCVRNSQLQETEFIAFNERFSISVNYSLRKKMDGLVGGIALYDSQNNYVCGLNTKIDNYPLPSEPGNYSLCLNYTNVALLPGKYYIDVGFFESSAVVSLDYSYRKFSLTIYSGNYIAEGITFLEHDWLVQEDANVKVPN